MRKKEEEKRQEKGEKKSVQLGDVGLKSMLQWIAATKV